MRTLSKPLYRKKPAKRRIAASPFATRPAASATKAGARGLSLFSWRLKKAFVSSAILAALSGVFSLLPANAQALSITNFSLSNTTLNYELIASSLTQVTTFFFTTDTPGLVSIRINRAGFGTVAVIQQSFASAGNQSYTWDGTWLIGQDYGRINGEYNFTLTLSSSTNGDTYVFTPVQTLTIDSVDIHNVNVTPSRDAAGETTFPYAISYALAKEAYVTAEIFDSSGTLVRTLLNRRLQDGETTTSTHTVTWDGLDSSGRAVAIGLYTVELNAFDTSAGGSGYPRAFPRTRTIAVTSLAGSATNPQRVFEENVFVYPNPIRDGQGIFQFAAVREGARITLKIYTIAGDLVFDHDFGVVAVGNVNQFTWNAVNKSGAKLGRGLYYYVLREEDNQGTLQTVKKLVILR